MLRAIWRCLLHLLHWLRAIWLSLLHWLRLRARLAALLVRLLAFSLDRVAIVATAAILGKRGRHCHAGKQYGEYQFTHDNDFLFSLRREMRLCP